MTLLKIEDLTIAFGTAAPVVDGVSIGVDDGEIVALVGESGSGKSLTARTILGLLPDGADATGSVTLGDTQLIGANEALLGSVRGVRAAMIFQEPQTALNPVQKIGWQITQALRAHGRISKSEARSRAIELLELVEIPDAASRVDWYPHQLSGGQKQRVVIALALSGEPDLLIADEPTTALDVTVQAEILDLLQRLRKTRGTAILLITHNMGVVADVADSVVVMREGRVLERQPVDRLFSDPSHQYTRDLLDAVPRLHEVRDRLHEKGSTEVLRLSDVSVVYPGRFGAASFTAIEGVDLTLSAGEVVGLVGESGSGKTTLGRLALGLVPATTGRVELLGATVGHLRASELRALRRGVALVHQDPAASLDPRRSVGQSIGEPLVVHKVATGAEVRSRTKQLLESVRLPADFVDRRPSELSGGQRQRVALARALALSPKLLVADEPTSALDVSVQAHVLELFAELREEFGFACLFVSHDLAVVDSVADRVVVLRRGTVVEEGRAAEVFRNPHHEYTRHLIESAPAAPVRAG
ncbi:dipeptide ABC transporter ATP-binding protein [Rhodococcoides fascians]|uniref:dipeptide ABC transporter ATP-binding protein n=1 Tax=Rhodococcoides fascians TaxID=1828 RepID=UPI000563C990|nr:ABC transporter ATP-binding protein [Rhodococcus fascians]